MRSLVAVSGRQGGRSRINCVSNRAAACCAWWGRTLLEERAGLGDSARIFAELRLDSAASPGGGGCARRIRRAGRGTSGDLRIGRAVGCGSGVFAQRGVRFGEGGAVRAFPGCDAVWIHPGGIGNSRGHPACVRMAAKANWWSPRGNLRNILRCEAKAWETIAFGKLRLIAGAERLAEEAAKSLAGAAKTLYRLAGVHPGAARDAQADCGLRLGPRASRRARAVSTTLISWWECWRRAPLCLPPGSSFGCDWRRCWRGNCLRRSRARICCMRPRCFAAWIMGYGWWRGARRKWLPESDVLRASVEHMVQCSRPG